MKRPSTPCSISASPAKEGTSLASAMAMQIDVKTNFAGFRLPEASVTLNLASK